MVRPHRAATVAGLTPVTFSATVINIRADLRVRLTTPGSVTRNGTFDARVTVTNLGPATAALAVTHLDLPSGVSIVSTGGGLAVGRSVTFVQPIITSGSSVTYTVRLRASASRGTRTLRAAAYSIVVDPKLGNNTASSKVNVR